MKSCRPGEVFPTARFNLVVRSCRCRNGCFTSALAPADCSSIASHSSQRTASVGRYGLSAVRPGMIDCSVPDGSKQITFDKY